MCYILREDIVKLRSNIKSDFYQDVNLTFILVLSLRFGQECGVIRKTIQCTIINRFSNDLNIN